MSYGSSLQRLVRRERQAPDGRQKREVRQTGAGLQPRLPLIVLL
jgi:hypothetical protein